MIVNNKEKGLWKRPVKNKIIFKSESNYYIPDYLFKSRINVIDVDGDHLAASYPSTFHNVSSCATIVPAPSSPPSNFAIPMFNFIVATPTPSRHAAQQNEDQALML